MSRSKINLKTWIKNPPTTGEYLGWRIMSVLLVGAMAGSAFFSAWFIYNNIYITVTNAASIVILESTQKIEAVDWTAFEQTKQNLILKDEKTEWAKNVRDIFTYLENPTSTVYEKK